MLKEASKWHWERKKKSERLINTIEETCGVCNSYENAIIKRVLWLLWFCKEQVWIFQTKVIKTFPHFNIYGKSNPHPHPFLF